MRDRNAPLTAADSAGLAWDKMDGLIPAVAQDAATGQVLMLGYMSPDALAATLTDGEAVFHSRSRGALWRKGETSDNVLAVRSVHADCDGDALLILTDPAGPTCHLGTASCFTQQGPRGIGWLAKLAAIVKARRESNDDESYTAWLFSQGTMRIAQKVGEEGLELALAATAGAREACIEEAADLVYHLVVLMEARGFGWEDVAAVLEARHKP